jgi:hypothetical protein
VSGRSALRSLRPRRKAASSSCSARFSISPRNRPRIAASSGSNQASPANSPSAAAAPLLFPSKAWSPPARQRRSWLVEHAGGYAAPNSPPHPRQRPSASRPAPRGGRGATPAHPPAGSGAAAPRARSARRSR